MSVACRVGRRVCDSPQAKSETRRYGGPLYNRRRLPSSLCNQRGQSLSACFSPYRDHKLAEQCFVAGVEDSVHGNNVFREWAHSWANRTIIQLAIRALQSKPSEPDSPQDIGTLGGRRSIPDRHDVVARLLSLDDFDRFVFVMSVLERHSEHECALLLGCTPPDVRESRRRALQQMTVGRPPRTEDDLFAAEVTSGVGGSLHD